MTNVVDSKTTAKPREFRNWSDERDRWSKNGKAARSPAFRNWFTKSYQTKSTLFLFRELNYSLEIENSTWLAEYSKAPSKMRIFIKFNLISWSVKYSTNLHEVLRTTMNDYEAHILVYLQSRLLMITYLGAEVSTWLQLESISLECWISGAWW